LFEKDNKFKPDLSGYEYIIERQLKPEFPSGLNKKLKDLGLVPTAMIDVSDGLASDLIHICKDSDTGCKIYYDKIPVDLETSRAAEEFDLDPVIPALNGGEDHELLFTARIEDHEKYKDIPGITMIGHLTLPGLGYKLVTNEGAEVELKAQGWENAQD
jgi:thiamine-monophosphate kinase